MRLYLLFLSGLILLALTNCQEQTEISPQTRTATRTRLPTPEIAVTQATATSPAVVTQEKITLLETPTPTITLTPTPFIYIVVEGDTLFDIAALHDTTIEAILALNPSLQPELLTIGQELILPEGARSAPAATSTTPIPLAIAVSGLSVYRTPANGMWVLGELINQGEHDLENVQVTITLLDEAGQSLSEAHLWPATSVVEAGSKSPFGTLVVPAPPGDVSPNAVVDSAAPIVDLGNRYLDFEVADAEATITGAQAVISGEIVNIGEKNASEIALIVTLYDDTGNVTGYHKSFLDEPLAAGISAPFEIHLLPPGELVNNFSFLVQGLVDSEKKPE
jgi:LysM repeat protein